MDKTPLRVSITRDASQARSLLDPLRRSILAALQEPGSSSSVAATMGLPRQRLNYHVRALEAEGLLRHVEDRKKGNCLERVVRTEAQSHVIDPGILGSGWFVRRRGPQRSFSFGADELVAASCRTLNQLGSLLEADPQEISRIPSLSLETHIRFRSRDAEVAFATALRELLDSLIEQHHDEDATEGRTFRITIGGHLDPEG